MTLTGGSLFSGIGGLELAASMAGLEIDWRWQVEIDPFCRDILARHFPKTDRSVTDVTEATNLEPVDVICGGFPCQDISVAGAGAGLAGERSGLWWEFARIIREVRPSFVLVENVSALLARGLGTVLGELAALGYDTEWDCIPACAVGAPHQRDRVWIIAHAHSHAVRDEQGRGRRTGGPRRKAEPVDASGSGQATDSHSIDGPSEAGRGIDWGAEGPSWMQDPVSSRRGQTQGWKPPSAVRRMDDGFPGGVDRFSGRRRDRARFRALGNAVVPQAAAVAWHRIKEVHDLTSQPP